LYIVWDVLALPSGDVRARPYAERRGLLLDVLESVSRPSPIQAVSATDDVEVAQAWYDTLGEAGVEGVVAKLAGSPYRPGRSSSWRKVRHAETVDADVVGYTGPASRPRALVVRLPDGRAALTQALTAPLAARVAEHIVVSGASRRARTERGDVYGTVVPGLVVEVLAGTTRHAVVSVTRLR
jgi:bifunctional non-homologous end joining protein LigD